MIVSLPYAGIASDTLSIVNLQTKCPYWDREFKDSQLKKKLLQKPSSHDPWHARVTCCFLAAPQFHPLCTSISPQISLETTGVSPGGSFLFVEEEGETSSERLLAGHTVLPFAQSQEPRGAAQRASKLQIFCRCTHTNRAKS